MSLKKQAKTGFLWGFIQQFSSQGISFIISIVMARLLLPSEFGLMGMIYVFFSVGNVLLDAGLAQSLIRTIDANDEDYSTVFFFNIFVGLVLYLLLFILAPFIASFYGQPILISIIRVYSFFFVIGSFSTVQNAILTKQMRFKSLLIISLPANIIGGLFGIFFAYFEYGVWSLVYYTLITTICNTLFLWIYSSWRPMFIFNTIKFKKHLNFGYKLSLTNLIDATVGNIYQIILGRFYSPDIVGLFTRSDSMKQIAVYSISTTVTKVSFPILASMQNDRERLADIYKKIMKSVVFLTTPVLVLMAIFAKPIIIFLFTVKWVDAVPYFQIIALGSIFMPINNYNINLFSIIGRSDIILKLEIIQKIILIFLVSISIPYGIIPLLWTQLVYGIICFFLNVAYSKNVINYSYFEQISDIGAVIFLNFIVGCLIYFVNYYYVTDAIPNFVQIFSGCFLFLVIYVPIAYLFKMRALLNIFELLRKNVEK